MQTKQLNLGTALWARISLVNIPPDEATLSDLRRHIFAYVDERKIDGWSPERVIIAVKQIARDAGLRPSGFITKIDAKMTSRDELLVEMVGWCIQRYFSPSDH